MRIYSFVIQKKTSRNRLTTGRSERFVQCFASVAVPLAVRRKNNQSRKRAKLRPFLLGMKQRYERLLALLMVACEMKIFAEFLWNVRCIS
jgi:hypothetical protein